MLLEVGIFEKNQWAECWIEIIADILPAINEQTQKSTFLFSFKSGNLIMFIISLTSLFDYEKVKKQWNANYLNIFSKDCSQVIKN